MANSKILKDNLLIALRIAKIHAEDHGYHENSSFKSGLESNIKAIESGETIKVID